VSQRNIAKKVAKKVAKKMAKSTAKPITQPTVIALLDDKATGIDVGSETMHVSIAGGAPQVFGTVTSQLHALRDYLLEQ
jgi:hypothetical protein